MSAADDVGEVLGCLTRVLIIAILAIVLSSSKERRDLFREFRHATQSIRDDWKTSADSAVGSDVVRGEK